MADSNAKVSDFITRTRQAATAYRNLINTLRALDNEWTSLYNTLVTDEQFSGSNSAVIPSGTPATQTASLTAVIGNMETIITSFDAGIDTNFERITQ